MESLSDLVGQLGGFRSLFGRVPTYVEYFGLWLNRKRTFFRQCGTVAYGTAIGLGLTDPGLSYYRAITDGEGEALLLKAQQDALRNQTNS